MNGPGKGCERSEPSQNGGLPQNHHAIPRHSRESSRHSRESGNPRVDVWPGFPHLWGKCPKDKGGPPLSQSEGGRDKRSETQGDARRGGKTQTTNNPTRKPKHRKPLPVRHRTPTHQPNHLPHPRHALPHTSSCQSSRQRTVNYWTDLQSVLKSNSWLNSNVLIDLIPKS